MEETEIITARLPAEISLTYEFKNPFKDTVAGRTKFSIDVKIYLTNQEAETLDKELIDIMLQAMNKIFEARKLEQDINTLTEDLKQVLDADVA
jgi:hypothetical protein